MAGSITLLPVRPPTGTNTGCGRSCDPALRMSLGGSLKVIGAGVIFRTTGADGAGYTLLDAFSGDDEQEKTLAGISIVKAGEKSLDLIEKARVSGRLTPAVVRLLPDIGGGRARALLSRISADDGPVADAAMESLDLLDEIETFEDD